MRTLVLLHGPRLLKVILLEWYKWTTLCDECSEIVVPSDSTALHACFPETECISIVQSSFGICIAAFRTRVFLFLIVAVIQNHLQKEQLCQSLFSQNPSSTISYVHHKKSFGKPIGSGLCCSMLKPGAVVNSESILSLAQSLLYSSEYNNYWDQNMNGW